MQMAHVCNSLHRTIYIKSDDPKDGELFQNFLLLKKNLDNVYLSLLQLKQSPIAKKAELLLYIIPKIENGFSLSIRNRKS